SQVELGFLNKGNLLIRPRGTIEIKTEDGFTVSKVLLNEESQAVLPRSERVFRIPLNDIKPGVYNLFATVDYGGSEILSGESRVNLIVEASRHSWPIPQSKNPIKRSSDKGSKPAVKASPEEIKALSDQATRQYASGDYESSLATWQKLLRADPANATARKNMERTRAKVQALKKIKG
ncbi:MAG: tetratricopeptide repeat protein, partial [Desulfocucumaceae bacterium]